MQLPIVFIATADEGAGFERADSKARSLTPGTARALESIAQRDAGKYSLRVAAVGPTPSNHRLTQISRKRSVAGRINAYLNEAPAMVRPSGGGCVTQWSRAACCNVILVHAADVPAFLGVYRRY